MEETSQSVVFLAPVLWLVCTRLESFMESGFYCERIKNQVNLVLWHRKSLKIEKIAKNWHLLKWTWEILPFLCLLRKKNKYFVHMEPIFNCVSCYVGNIIQNRHFAKNFINFSSKSLSFNVCQWPGTMTYNSVTAIYILQEL